MAEGLGGAGGEFLFILLTRHLQDFQDSEQSGQNMQLLVSGFSNFCFKAWSVLLGFVGGYRFHLTENKPQDSRSLSVVVSVAVSVSVSLARALVLSLLRATQCSRCRCCCRSWFRFRFCCSCGRASRSGIAFLVGDTKQQGRMYYPLPFSFHQTQGYYRFVVRLQHHYHSPSPPATHPQQLTRWGNGGGWLTKTIREKLAVHGFRRRNQQ